MMRFRIESVVDAAVRTGTGAKIAVARLGSSTIGEDRVVSGHVMMKWIVRIVLNSQEGCRCIDIPENHDAASLQFENAMFEEGIIYAQSTVLDNDVGLGCPLQHRIQANGGFIVDRVDVREVAFVTITRAIKRVRRGKGNLVATTREVFVDASIISSC